MLSGLMLSLLSMHLKLFCLMNTMQTLSLLRYADAWIIGIVLGLSQKFAQNASRNFPSFSPIILLKLCLQYASKFLVLSWRIQSTDCSIRAFHYKVTVLSESIDIRSSNNSLAALLESIDLFYYYNYYKHFTTQKC